MNTLQRGLSGVFDPQICLYVGGIRGRGGYIPHIGGIGRVFKVYDEGGMLCSSCVSVMVSNEVESNQ